MMSVFGKNIVINLFGESHGSAIGMTINHLPAGIQLDMDDIRKELTKRRPKSKISTPRQEQDDFEFLSGVFNGFTTGAPLTVVIYNKDTRSRDYHPEVLRPSHADYTSHVKYKGYTDYRGSGHFSGRITAPIMILGSICKQILAKKGIIIASHISSIKDVKDDLFRDFIVNEKTLKSLLNSDFPLLNPVKEEIMKQTILDASNQQDSVGGTIETMIYGLEAGYGTPFFDSIESTISHLIFSVPAVKGISFGRGFDITTLYGSEANDSFAIVDNTIKTVSNNSGGIQGGISNGMPITFNTAIKPTASIGKPQKTVNVETMKEEVLELKGRHDPAIVHRVIHVINAITNYAILEIITRKEGDSWIK